MKNAKTNQKAKQAKEENPSFTKELGRFMRPYGGLYGGSVLLSVLSVTAGLAAYAFAGMVAALLFSPQKEWQKALLFTLLAVGCKVLHTLLLNCSTWLSHHAAYSTLKDIRTALTDKMLRLPMGYFEERGTGRLKSMLVDYVEDMEKTLAHMLPELTANLLGPLALSVFMFVVDYRLALIAFGWMVVGMSVSSLMMRGYEAKFAGQIQAKKDMTEAVVEYVNGIEVIKNFGREGECFRRYSDKVYGHAAYNVGWQKETQQYSSLGMAIAPFSVFPVLIAGLLFYGNGSLSPAALFLMILLTLGIFGPIMGAMGYFDRLAAMGTEAKEINSVLSYPELKRGKDLSPAAHDVTFRDVSFSYGNAAKNALSHVSFHIDEGKMLALVGPSGSGKSTVAKLLAGYWDPTHGEISVGGVDVSRLTETARGNLIAFVDQETFLFDTTIGDNIRIGRENATAKEVEAAARAAGCHEFIKALPLGYDTPAGEAGGRLSGGERQRVAIARAMLKDAPILILDEATASTDPENEAAIERALSAAAKGKTLIVVAHNLATVQHAAAIAFVEEGEIKAMGTHEELLRTFPPYRTMWEKGEMSHD